MIQESKNSNKILAKVYSTDEDNATCSYAIIELSPAFITKVKAMKEQLEIAKAGLGSVYQLNVFDNSCDFINEQDFDDVSTDSEILDDFSEILDNKEYAKINIPEETKLVLIRDDSTLLYVTENGFKFSCYIKHTSILLNVTTLPFDVLENITDEDEEKLTPFTIDVIRTGYGYKSITVMAADELDAQDKALEDAGNHEYTEKDADYSIAD